MMMCTTIMVTGRPSVPYSEQQQDFLQLCFCIRCMCGIGLVADEARMVLVVCRVVQAAGEYRIPTPIWQEANGRTVVVRNLLLQCKKLIGRL